MRCPEPTCIDGYMGESSRRIIERIKYHNGRDTSHDTSLVLKHSIEKSHKNVKIIVFKINGKNFYNNIGKRKIVDAS